VGIGEFPDLRNLRIDTYHGGTVTVRVTDLLTGHVGTGTDERSEIRAREKALDNLAANRSDGIDR
jgi:hypothetical protein